MIRALLLLAVALLAGCTITIHVEPSAPAVPAAKAPGDGYEYSVTHNVEAARAFGWEPVGPAPDGSTKVRRKPGRYVEAAK